MAIDNGKVKNIYVTAGNFNVMYVPMLFDGEGEDPGLLPKEDKNQPPSRE